jgi:predicted DNA-binding transcriptional regulator AlpA
MTIATAPEFLTLADLCHRYRCSRSWIVRRIANTGFPKGVHIGGSKRPLWRRRDVEKWEADERNHVPPPVNVGLVQ